MKLRTNANVLGIRSRRTPVLGVLPLLVAIGGCDAGNAPSPTEEPGEPGMIAASGPAQRNLAGAQLGDPIPGLTAEELAAFQRGQVLFEKRFTPAEGLGPLYNATSCRSCHSQPVTGGSAELYRNFYLAMIGTAPSQLAHFEAPSPVVPAFGPHDLGGSTFFSLESGRLVIPPNYFGLPVVVAQRNAISIFGTGLFEFVSNATILANEDPFDANGDGISGRGNYDFGDLGRFGLKAQSNNIERFTRPPLRNQMGITTDPFLGSAGTVSLASVAVQGTSNPNNPTTDMDPVPDPELSHDDLGDLIAFSRFLAPPALKLPFTPAALQGQQLFGQINCTACHLPSLDSSLGPVEAYTDLLLHDMGPGLADNLQFGQPLASTGSTSSASEFRSQPLWGVSLHGPWLHDGRAETLSEAIEAHGGEAQAIRDAYLALSSSDQQAVVEFLEHL